MTRHTLADKDVFFKTKDDPFGRVHVFEKYKSADTACVLLLRLIAKHRITIRAKELLAEARSLQKEEVGTERDRRRYISVARNLARILNDENLQSST